MKPDEQQAAVSPEHDHPHVYTIELDAATPYAEKAEFSTAHWNDHQENLRHGKTNVFYLHTFKWQPNHPNETVVEATLVADMKALSSGDDRRSDKMYIMGAGSQIAHYQDAVYVNRQDYPVQGATSVLFSETQVRKVWPVVGTALQRLNERKTLSIAIGDDSYVQAATLTLTVRRH